MSRDEFEEILGAMARANFPPGQRRLRKGRQGHPYRKVSLTPDGEALEESWRAIS
jgi:hypothetical protein